MRTLEETVARHYGRADLMEAILAGLAAAGADPDRPRPTDLAPVDEFHTAGRMTTLKALGMTPIEAGMRVLDAGCGIGGTARVLAGEHGCSVAGIDLTPEYVAAARELTERTGLSERCEFHLGSVVDMPFPDASFDAAVSFHVAMNIGDREGFYAELARVLRPGGALCLFDVMKGPSPGLAFPVPWAASEETSFLRTPVETASLLRGAGFDITAEKSLRALAIDFFREVAARTAQAGGPPPLGLHLLTGADAREKFANYVAALTGHQVDPVVVIATRR